MPGTPKIDETAISEFRKIIMPMIRRIMPTLIAQEIVGVQPMYFSNRDRLYRDNEAVVSYMIVNHVSIRPFMAKNCLEPNHHYRPWLEEHIGEQGVKWNWEICGTDIDYLEIYFTDKEHATLFELTWP